ncbi:phage tail protein [Aeromonas veronii]
MSQVITNAFEQYWQSCLAAEKPVVLDEFILADIPNLDITSPIDPETGLPPENQIVHRQNVDQRGRINNNAVAYTIVMDTTVGDFSFNAMYLRNKQNGVIGMIVYKGRETKLKTDQTTGQTGNSLVKSMLMGYDRAAEATLTHVDAGTWQIDYAARLRGMDEDVRQLQADLYGHHTFVGDGFKVVEKDGAYQVSQGVAIVGGLRVELKAPEVIHPGTKPIGVWVDVHRAGSLLSEHQNHFTIITSVADLTDHVDSNGYQHYVAKLGTVQADGTVIDDRGQSGSGGSGALPDTFALWKRSMAEAGYDLIGQFGTELTIETAEQVVLSKDGNAVYAWTGDIPKDVSKDEDPKVEQSQWLNVVDDVLRIQLQALGGAGKIGEKGGGTVQGKLDELSKYASSELKTIFKYKLKRVLPLNPVIVSNVVSVNGYQYLYPQAFSYGKDGDIYVNFSANDKLATWVVKFNANNAAVSIFKAFDGLSEVSYFYTSGGIDYYVTGGKGTLITFNVTSLPDGESVQTPVSINSPDVYFGGCGYDSKRMLLEEWATPLGTVTRRNRFFVYNIEDDKREHSVTLPFQIVGAASGTPYDTITHKTQGVAAFSGGIYLAHGRMADGTEVDVNHATGLSLVNWQGNAVMTGLITAETFKKFLTEQGLSPTRVENEGVTIGSEGCPHVMHIYLESSATEAKAEGIAISSVGEPFGSIDLSYGAIAPITATYYGKSVDGLKNPYTGETMDTMAKILDFMVATDSQEYWFYTGTATVTDLDGTTFPGSTMVRIYNQNNYTFFYETINAGVQTWWFSGTPYSKNYMGWCGTGRGNDITNTVAGSASGRNITDGDGNSFYGHLSGEKLSEGKGNTFVGQNSGREVTTANNSTHIGRGAGRFQLDGVTPNNFDYCTTIGYNAFTSGPNQVQLGGAGTTPYAYAALQIRSDERDKAEWHEIDEDLAVSFVRGLKSGFYKLDLRDDYYEEYVEEIGLDDLGNPILDIKHRPIDKDGSKKRNRWHAGYLSQQVKALMDELGIDFGMYQDHLVNGGCDVKTLGYEQSIPLISKAVDVAFKKIEEIERRLKNIGG